MRDPDDDRAEWLDLQDDIGDELADRDEILHTLELARSLIRDALLFDWPTRELAASPISVVELITRILRDGYDPETSTVANDRGGGER